MTRQFQSFKWNSLHNKKWTLKNKPLTYCVHRRTNYLKKVICQKLKKLEFKQRCLIDNIWDLKHIFDNMFDWRFSIYGYACCIIILSITLLTVTLNNVLFSFLLLFSFMLFVHTEIMCVRLSVWLQHRVIEWHAAHQSLAPIKKKKVNPAMYQVTDSSSFLGCLHYCLLNKYWNFDLIFDIF